MCDRHNTGCREHRGHSGFCFNRQGVGLCDPDCPPDHGYPEKPKVKASIDYDNWTVTKADGTTHCYDDFTVSAVGKWVTKKNGSPVTDELSELLSTLQGGNYGRQVRREPDKGVSPLKRDNVSHYTVGEIECIDYIFDKLGYEGGMAYILGNLIKYSSRANHKGQRKSDVNKIRNYATIGLEKMAQYAPEEP